jgi:Zn-dependent peptidase ImmA (M78 family)
LILADFFKVDYRFLISNQRLTAVEQTETLYRRFGNEFTKEDRRAIAEFLFLCECEQMLRHELRRPIREFHFTPRGTHFKSHATLAANELRSHFAYGPLQVPSDVYEDLRQLGFHVFMRRLLNSKISGLTIRHPLAGTCILVNYDEDMYRQRFTAAHEGAHGILDLSEDVIVSFTTSDRRADLIEIRANTFAARYLLPQAVVTSLPVSKWTENDLIDWASRLKVSTAALLIALKEARQIDPIAVFRLSRVRVPRSEKTDPELIHLSGRAVVRKRSLLERGLSSSYVNLCFDAHAAGLVSAARVGEMMLVDEFELTEISDLFQVNLRA